jgi:hypothetical protein
LQVLNMPRLVARRREPNNLLGRHHGSESQVPGGAPNGGDVRTDRLDCGSGS